VLWKEALGEQSEAIWNAFRVDQPPPLELHVTRVERPSWVPWLAAASLAAVLVLGGLNLRLLNELESVRTQQTLTALSLSAQYERLAVLNQLQGQAMDPQLVAAIRVLLLESEDPNVQLAALDLLWQTANFDNPDEVARLIRETRHNRAFIQAAIQSRTTRI
ncbi:MAG: hypothetical protein AAGJ52_08540, partial [Pseudomonadota bacterium]